MDFDATKLLIKEIVREFEHQKNVIFLIPKLQNISSKYTKGKSFTYFLYW